MIERVERAVDAGAERCSIARSLEVLGQKWSLLIVREAMWGRTRFAEFRARLGVAPDVLTDRLGRLVDAGILERRPYREDGEREREEYVLTDAGRALLPVLAAMSAWGDEYRPERLRTRGALHRPRVRHSPASRVRRRRRQWSATRPRSPSPAARARVPLA